LVCSNWFFPQKIARQNNSRELRASIPDPPASIRSARFWTNSQEITGRGKRAPLRRSRSAGIDPLILTRWTITSGQLFAALGSRYVWQGARSTARGLIYYRRKKARTMAGSRVTGCG